MQELRRRDTDFIWASFDDFLLFNILTILSSIAWKFLWFFLKEIHWLNKIPVVWEIGLSLRDIINHNVKSYLVGFV